MQPVAPFTPPAFLANITTAQVMSVVFALVFILWAIYTVVTAYHWLRYGHRSAVAIPALITHVLISGYIALFAVSGIAP